MATADKTSLKNKHDAPINVKPQGGEGEGEGRQTKGIWHFHESQSQIARMGTEKMSNSH